jgi:hypothetical protein
MRGDNKLTVFAWGNGDTIMLEAHDRTVLVDIHYRRDQAEDPENDRVPDFAHDIWAACADNPLPPGSPASLMVLAGGRAAPWPWRPKHSGSSAPEEVGFAVDSLLEEAGFDSPSHLNEKPR